VRAFHGLHTRLSGRGRWGKEHSAPPIVRGSVIRVDVEHLPKRDGRQKKTLWLWWSGPREPDLDLCFRAYLHRFDLEHTYRFVKNTLGWTAPSLCMPEQADRWTWQVVSAYTELRLARGLVDDLRLPWERPCDPAKLTPSRVGVSSTSCIPRHSSQPTEIRCPGTRTSKRQSQRPANALSGGQEGSVTRPLRFNCKLSSPTAAASCWPRW
jgi:hypothetical protein